MFNVMRPKERCSIPKLEKRLRKKGIKFSDFASDEAVIRLINERKAKISTYYLICGKSKDLVIKEITRPQKPT